MNKVELVSYLADLIVIDDYLDDLGVSNPWMNREEKEGLDQLKEMIEEEHKKADEARKSEQQRQGTENGTQPSSGQPGGSGPAGGEGGDQSSSPTPLRG